MESKNVAYLERLDHIRFFAATMVLLFHTYLDFRDQPEMHPDPVHVPLILQGHTGVPLFMIISGMILAIIVNGKEVMIWNFYKNRILRIYPLFIFIVTLGYFATRDPRPTSVGIDYLMSLLPISNLYRLQYGPFGGQLWSIAVELQFYLLFPFIMTLKARYGLKYFLSCIGFLLFLRLGVFRINHTVHGLSYFTLLGNLDIFLIGILTGETYLACQGKTFWWTKKYVVGAYVLALNGVFYLFFLNKRFFHVDFDHVTADGVSPSSVWIYWPTLQALFWSIFVLLYLCSEMRVPGASLLSRFGKYSYSMYIWHIFVLQMIPKSQVGWMTPYTLGLFVVLPVTIAVAAASYHLIEEPFFAFRVRYTRTSSLLVIREDQRQAA